jgi:Transcription-silencing protein, cryptic loci regulator Clr2/Transcription-silencing protein Clr2
MLFNLFSYDFLTGERDYVLKDWPQGYRMFDHNKGPEEAPRHDAYLMGEFTCKFCTVCSVHDQYNAIIGSKLVGKFRSIPEFIPHALWLLQDATGDRTNCKCKYCTKAPSQRAITFSMGLLPKRTPSVSATPPRRAQGLVRAAKQRENRDREQHKPYAAVRRAPRLPKQPVAPKANMLRERNADLRAAYGSSGMKIKRWFREGELLWCALSAPIRGRNGDKDTIAFWPGLVEEVRLKSEAIPRDPTVDDKSVVMNGITDEPSSPAGPPKDWRATEHPSSIDSGPVLEGNPPMPWTVHQSTVYKVKLLAVSYSYSVQDDHVLPYQAYAPTTELLNAVQTVPFEELDVRAERIASFDPCPAPPSNPEGGFVSNDSGLRFNQAAAPYAVAVQIAATLAGCWTMTDEWEFKHTVGPTVGPNGPLTQTLTPGRIPSLHDVLTASMDHNAALHARADSGSISGLNAFPKLSMAQTVTQRRYQGMWWGAERIWTDDLIRLKVARSQIAPEGAECIFPPSGPSRQTIEYNSRLGFPNPDGKEYDARGRGVFMKLEALFIADVPREDGQGTKEQVRASGMLYELADVDWQDSEAERSGQIPETSGGAIEPVGSLLSGEGLLGQDTPVFSDNNATTSSMAQVGPSLSLPQMDTATSSTPGAPQDKLSSKQRSSNVQLSRPANSERYPMPPAPTGFKFRPILPPGHESVISLTLISGRYYPCLLSHPLLQPIVDGALVQASECGGPMENEHLWAMEGLSPGYFNCVDPTHYKKDRLQMMKDADKEAHMELEMHWQERQREKAAKIEDQQDQQLMDVGP